MRLPRYAKRGLLAIFAVPPHFFKLHAPNRPFSLLVHIIYLVRIQFAFKYFYYFNMNTRTFKRKHYDVMAKTIIKNACKFNKKSSKTRASRSSFKNNFFIHFDVENHHSSSFFTKFINLYTIN